MNYLEEKTLTETYHFKGRVINLRVDEAELPDGHVAIREIVEHPGGVCVAALTADGMLPFVRQFRYPYKEIVTELPAGKLERGEDPFDAVQRELSEEVGAEGTNWRSMGKLYPTPGYCEEIIHLFACDIQKEGTSHPDEDEFLEVEYIRLEDAVQMVLDGKLPDAKTQTLVLKLWAEKKNNE
ncbi:MAG: NUDIX hydrolase [Clostridia bacterium]|nr:NUDIX hydrolase [Clostridia bacterium]